PPRAARARAQRDLRSEAIGDARLEALEVAIARDIAATRARAPRAALVLLRDALLRLAHRQAAFDDLLGEHDLLRPVDREQRACMAHVEVARHEHRLYGFGQVEQAQQVAGRAARAADRLGGLLVRRAGLVDQAPDALRLLERIEVLALDVLDEREGERGLVVGLAHDHRHFVELGELRRAVAPLPRDDLVARWPAVARLGRE